MGSSRCYSLMKSLTIIFSCVFLCVGVAVCGFCVWALWEGVAEGGGGGGAGRAGLVAAGAWGAALALGALAALAGAARGRPALLAAAAALLALSAVAEAAAAWWGAAHLPHLRLALRDRLADSLRHDYGRLHSATQVIDAIQTGLECCGAESARDWQGSAWSRAQAAAAAVDPADPAAPAPADPPPAPAPLDLSVGAPSAYYWVPVSCCVAGDATECEVSRRVSAAASGAAGLHAAPCAPRVLGALAAGARAPLAAAAALAAAHALLLLLTLALCLRARPHHRYKA